MGINILVQILPACDKWMKGAKATGKQVHYGYNGIK